MSYRVHHEWGEEAGDVIWRQDSFAFENVTYSHWHTIKRRSWHTAEVTNTSSKEKEYQLLHNAQTSAERQMEGKCNSQVEEMARKSYIEELQVRNMAEWLCWDQAEQLNNAGKLVQDEIKWLLQKKKKKKRLKIILHKKRVTANRLLTFQGPI